MTTSDDYLEWASKWLNQHCNDCDGHDERSLAAEFTNIATEARRKAIEEAATECRQHGEFCKYEADHGGSFDLYERSRGAFHLMHKILSPSEIPARGEVSDGAIYAEHSRKQPGAMTDAELEQAMIAVRDEYGSVEPADPSNTLLFTLSPEDFARFLDECKNPAPPTELMKQAARNYRAWTAAQVEPPVGQGWQPIETAPSDRPVQVCWLCEGEYERIEYVQMYLGGEAFMNLNSNNLNRRRPDQPHTWPSHWRDAPPLPAPPQKKEGE